MIPDETRYRILVISILKATLLLGITGADNAIGQQFRYYGSVQYATGSYYFTERTGSFYFNNGLGISGEKITASFNIPLITQNTPWISYSSTGVGLLPTGGPKSGIVDSTRGPQGNRKGKGKIDPGTTDTLSYTETQFGDPSLSASFKLYEGGYRTTSIQANLGLKFPLADPNSGFGTGAWDAGAGISWSQQVKNNFLFVLSGMYWQLGDMDDLDFNNILSYSAAVGRSFRNGKLMATTSFFGSTEIIDGVAPPINVGGGLNFQVSNQIYLNTNFLLGLTESSSDLSISFGWTINL